MYEVSRQVFVPLPGPAVFAQLSDHRTVTRWMPGLTRFDAVSHVHRRRGDLFDAEFSIGPATLTSTIAVVTWEEGHRIAVRSRSGIESAGEITVHDDPENAGSTVHAVLQYRLPGGLLGRALARITSPFADAAAATIERSLLAHIASRPVLAA